MCLPDYNGLWGPGGFRPSPHKECALVPKCPQARPASDGRAQRIFTMEILFKTATLHKQCTISRTMIKKWGQRRSELIRRRLDDLDAVQTLGVMRALPGHCHELKGDRSGQLAVSLDGAYRLVFEPADEPRPTAKGGGLDWERVSAIRILSVEDYHG